MQIHLWHFLCSHEPMRVRRGRKEKKWKSRLPPLPLGDDLEEEGREKWPSVFAFLFLLRLLDSCTPTRLGRANVSFDYDRGRVPINKNLTILWKNVHISHTRSL